MDREIIIDQLIDAFNSGKSMTSTADQLYAIVIEQDLVQTMDFNQNMNREDGSTKLEAIKENAMATI